MNSRFWGLFSVAATVLFIILLITLHFIEPEFTPSIHQISEYELGRYGWIMSIDFFSLGAGVLAMLFFTWSSTTLRRGLIGRWWFLAISIAFFGAGLFYPYNPPTYTSYIHGICGLIIIVTFPIAASLYYSGLTRSQKWTGSQRILSLMTWLVWFGLLFFMGSTIILGVLSGPVSRTEATLSIGWQNRFMILTYALWPMAVVWSTKYFIKKDV
jgi:hypothetical protein